MWDLRQDPTAQILCETIWLAGEPRFKAHYIWNIYVCQELSNAIIAVDFQKEDCLPPWNFNLSISFVCKLDKKYNILLSLTIKIHI